MKSGLTIALIFLFTRGFAQVDSSHYIKVNFLYEAAPAYRIGYVMYRLSSSDAPKEDGRNPHKQSDTAP